ALIFAQIARARWGDDAVGVEIPSYLSQPVMIGDYALPFDRDVFLVGVTILILAAVWLLINKTNIGIIIRAGTRDTEMVKILGINMPAMFTLVFGIASFLGALCGRARA